MTGSNAEDGTAPFAQRWRKDGEEGGSGKAWRAATPDDQAWGPLKER